MAIFSKSQTQRPRHRYIAAKPHPHYVVDPVMTKTFAWLPIKTERGRVVWFKFFYIRKEINIEGHGKIVWSTKYHTMEEATMFKLRGS